MERISIPFVAGIATSALMSAADGQSIIAGIATSMLMFAFICSVLIAHEVPQRDIVYHVVFFVAGLFCHATAMSGGGLTEEAPSHVMKIAAIACDKLKSAIDSLELGAPERNNLLKALLTGDRTGLSGTTTSSFRAAGASHILALSGLHMGIIYTILARSLAFMGNSTFALRLRSMLLVIAGAFYTVMTGAGPSIVRAFLFILLSELCRNLPGRAHDPARMLQAALIIQLAVSPTVISSLGFQLSYLAVSGIVWIMPKISVWFPDDGKPDPMKKLWNLCALSISCQCLTAPLVWIRFRTFPRFFLVTNLVAMPLTTLSIASSVFCLTAGTHCPEFALEACGQCVSMLLRFIDVLASLS